MARRPRGRGAGLHTNPWWREAVIYQIYPRSFMDASGNGVGDLAGIIGKLDYLSWLGVDAIWLSPIYPSPMADFGYDVSDYTGVDPLFGTLEDFDRLLAQAHRLGLKVILDFVPNHTSTEHPWFAASRSSRRDFKRDWYIWRDPKPDGSGDGVGEGSPPNNWRGGADFGSEGSAWVWDEGSGQYYLATFSPGQPDLNWRNPEVRESIFEAMRFWLSRGVDGFRLDMVDFLAKDERLRDEAPLADGWDMEAYLTAAKFQLNRPENLRYVRDMRSVVEEFGEDRVLIGETNYYVPVERLAAFGATGLLDLPSNFRLTFLPFEAAQIRAFADAYDAACTAAGAWPNWCLGNHDAPRVSRLGPEGARLAAVLLLTLRGTPFIYYGDEIGMANVEVPPEKRRDPWTHSVTGAGRDGVRTPMQWSADAHAGFSETEPWLPVDPGHRSANVAAQAEDPSSMLTLTRRLISLRRAIPALRSGSYEPAGAPDSCFAFSRRLEGQEVSVALNFGAGEAEVPLPGATDARPWRVLLSTGGGDREGQELRRTARLSAHEGLLLSADYP